MTDDDLRAQMRGIDPAASLEPLSSERVSQILEPIVDADHDVVSRPASGFWSRRGQPVAAAAVLAAAAAGIFGGVWASSDDHSGPAPVVVQAKSDGGALAKCAAPTADQLRTADLAVQGTVSSISDGTVAIDVSRVWSGNAVDVLKVNQTSGASESLLGGLAFEVGQSYFVSIDGGTVLGCGYSGVASPELEALFQEAF